MRKTSRSGNTMGIRVKGIITDIKEGHYYVKLKGLEREVRIEKRKQDRYESPIVPMQRVSLIYLTRDSINGNYKDKEFNLPYEIIDNLGKTIYQQNWKTKKQKIYEDLQKAELRE